MKTRDWPLFVGIAPTTLLGGLCLAALTTQAQNVTWAGGVGTGFWKPAGDWGPSPNPQFIL
jgi:hypothetical protein